MKDYNYTLMLWYVTYVTDVTRLGTPYFIYNVGSTQTGKESTIEVFHPDHLRSVLLNLEH